MHAHFMGFTETTGVVYGENRFSVPTQTLRTNNFQTRREGSQFEQGVHTTPSSPTTNGCNVNERCAIDWLSAQ